MVNPYESPNAKHDCTTIGWAGRFVLAFSAIALLNFGPTLVTWQAFHGDGMEQTGFPFVFYERGGFSYHESFHLKSLVADIVVAFVVATIIASLLRDGWAAFVKRIQALPPNES